MQLHEVDEVKELFIVGEVNEALQHGWRIVAVVSSVEPGSHSEALIACYIMGRKGVASADLAPRERSQRNMDALSRAAEALDGIR